jgi:hypothetical protein
MEVFLRKDTHRIPFNLSYCLLSSGFPGMILSKKMIRFFSSAGSGARSGNGIFPGLSDYKSFIRDTISGTSRFQQVFLLQSVGK